MSTVVVLVVFRKSILLRRAETQATVVPTLLLVLIVTLGPHLGAIMARSLRVDVRLNIARTVTRLVICSIGSRLFTVINSLLVLCVELLNSISVRREWCNIALKLEALGKVVANSCTARGCTRYNIL